MVVGIGFVELHTAEEAVVRTAGEDIDPEEEGTVLVVDTVVEESLCRLANVFSLEVCRKLTSLRRGSIRRGVTLLICHREMIVVVSRENREMGRL